jgi:hypothetical protein
VRTSWRISMINHECGTTCWYCMMYTNTTIYFSSFSGPFKFHKSCHPMENMRTLHVRWREVNSNWLSKQTPLPSWYEGEMSIIYNPAWRLWRHAWVVLPWQPSTGLDFSFSFYACLIRCTVIRDSHLTGLWEQELKKGTNQTNWGEWMQ